MKAFRRVAAVLGLVVVAAACGRSEDTGPTQIPATIGPAKVGGELLVPPNAFQPPGVVMVPGAGPNDRDETVGALTPFRDIAVGLAARGVATLRYDKRTLGRAPVPAGFTTNDEYVVDALDAFVTLRASGRVDPNRIFVLGHSFGGTIAPRVAAAQPRFAGAILLAAPARPLPETLLRQFRYLASLGGPTGDAARAQVQSAEGLLAESRSPVLQPSDPIASPIAHDAIAPGLTGAYFLDLRRYDPLRTASALGRPVLVVSAGRDFLVGDDDLQRWARALGDAATVRRFPLANHVFVNGSGPPTPAEYEREGHVSDALIEEIAGWVLAN